jgi:hypothetical protein
MAVGIDDVRDLTAGLPRSYEVFVGRRIKFRVGRIVYLAFSRNETLMGFAFPKEEREAALETYPDKFLCPKPSDMRYQWLVVRLEAIDKDELRELVFDAWRMVVPKKLAALSDDELRQLGVAWRARAAESPQAPRLARREWPVEDSSQATFPHTRASTALRREK